MVNRVLPAVRRSLRILLVALVLAGVAGACQSKPAVPAVSADAWAVVNGREITGAAVEKAVRRDPRAA